MTGGRFERCLRFTLHAEGGYSNDPADHGGSTYMGITQASLDSAREKGLTSVELVKNLTPEKVESLYFGGYWLPCRAYEFPAPLDLCLFDAYVNHRPEPAVKMIQAAVGAVQDGIIGPATVRAAHASELVSAVERYARAREAFYRQIVQLDPTQEKFLRGWLNRVADVKTAALAEVA